MANVNFINTTIPTGDQARLMELQRRQQMADLLMAQGMKEDKGQMVGDIYVAPSWTQGLARMANAWAGTRVADQNVKDIQKIATDRETERNRVFNQMGNISQGLPAGMDPNYRAPDLPAWAGEQPKPETIPVAQRGQMMLDLLMKSGDPQLQNAGMTAMMSRLLKDPKWEVTDRFNEQTGKKERVLIDMNNPANVVPFGGQEARNLSFQNLGSELVGFDPTTGARVTSANTSMSPSDSARLNFDIYKFGNLSADQRVNAQQGNARLGMEGARLGYETGMSGGGGAQLPPNQPMPDFFGGQQPMAPMTQTAPTVPQGAPMVRPTAPVAPRMPGQPAASPGRPQAVLDPQAAAAAGVGVQPTAAPGGRQLPQKVLDAAAGKQLEAQQEAARQLPTVIDTAQQGIANIDRLIGDLGVKLPAGQKPRDPHPGFSALVGATYKPGFRFIDGTEAASASKILDQIRGQAFLQAFESLKGGGQITEIEGKKATDAITRMDRAQSEKDFIEAAREFQGVIRKGVERARSKAGGGASGGWKDVQ